MAPKSRSRKFWALIYIVDIYFYNVDRYHMDPSGTFIKYEAKAIGSGSEGAQQALQDVYHKVLKKIYLKDLCSEVSLFQDLILI